MTWIRGLFWDGAWLLSGLSLGAALSAAVYLGVPAGPLLLLCFVVFSTSHNLSPIVLAWTHRGFREHMLRHRIKFVVIPILLMLAGILAGCIGSITLPDIHFNPDAPGFSSPELTPTFDHLRNPFTAAVLLYVLWNGYHFGRQSWGVMSIYRIKQESVAITSRPSQFDIAFNYNLIGRHRDSPAVKVRARAPDATRPRSPHYKRFWSQRTIDLWYCCTVTWLTMLMPFVPRLMQGLHDWTGLLSRGDVDYVKPVYFALAVIAIGVMLARELWRGTCPQRMILIVTNGLGLVLIWYAGLWGFAIISMNHWLTAIGLASHVEANHSGRSAWALVLGLIILGLIVFASLFVRWPTYFGEPMGWGNPFLLDPERWLSFTTTAVGIRLGLGFGHFLYDRWLWKMSNPTVRATIGRDLFASPERQRIEPFPAMAD